MTRAQRAVLALLLVLACVSDRLVARTGPARAARIRSQTTAPAAADTVRIGVLRNGSYEVISLPTEVYVARVLAGEAAPESPAASLEALAIAVRTYTATNRGRHGADGFDLCDQTHCQVMRTATPATDRAALSTAEQVLLHEGAPATVFYSASCGGRSEKPSNVWPGADDPPYLPIHDDDGCEGFPRWSAELAEADLQRAFTAGGYTGTLRDIRILSRNGSGRVAMLSVDGLTPRQISGQDLRMVVGRALGFQHIQSTQFELRRSGRAFRFTGRGAGHGVGMCVIGSMKLAARGESTAAILARYFPGTQIGQAGPRLTAVPPGSGPIPGVDPRTVQGVVETSASTATSVPGARLDRAVAGSGPGPDAADQPAVRGDVMVSVPPRDADQRSALILLAGHERELLAQVLGVPVPTPLRLRVHDTNDAFERATGQSWFTLSALAGNEIQLAPLWLLRERGMLERALRRQLVHLMVDGVLPGRPAWIRDGAAVHFADPDAPTTARPPCPTDTELQRPTSIGARGDAYARARACFERQIAGGRDWRRVR